MPFDKETASKAGKKSSRSGKSNKITNEVREKFNLLVSDNTEKLQEDLDKLEPKDRIKAILDMAKFVLPSLKATSLSFTDENGDDFDLRKAFGFDKTK